MKSFRAITGNIIFALQILLLFLVLFESRLSLPPIAQVFGRMHPMVLHLPIGLLVLLGALPLLRREMEEEGYRKIQGFALQLTALTAVGTALLGLFLAQEGGYGVELGRHKWTGIFLSWLTYGLLLLHQQRPRGGRLFNGGLIASLVLVVVTGHLGADLTHGKGFVLAPLQEEKAPVVTAETTVYQAAIAPILARKCESCHNERKSKGGLIMTSLKHIMAGGDNGPLWMAGDAGESHLLQRVSLPLEHEEHMPPDGKPQLTESEIQLLTTWIDAGADTAVTIGGLPPGDSLRPLVQPVLRAAVASAGKEPRYDFPPASPKVIESLNNPFRTVMPAAVNSPALYASIFVRQAYEPRYLEELSKVKEQLVSLNLSNLPIKDDDLKTISRFSNLEELILNGTDITGATLGELRDNGHLRSLALSSTQIDGDIIGKLAELEALEELFVWNTPLTEAALSQLKDKFPEWKIHTGYQPDLEEKLPLSAPILRNKEKVLAPGEKVALKHNFPGIAIRYTLDGSDPDSLESPLYETPFEIEGHATVKARAYQDGWLSSPVAEFSLFERGLLVDSMAFMEYPDPKYPVEDATVLQDGRKGDPRNFRSGAWLTFRERPFSTLFFLEEPENPIDSLVLSYLLGIGSYIMPPAAVEVWGGDDPENLKLLNKVVPDQPENYERNTVRTVSVPVSDAGHRCYKVVARPVNKLPAWHRGAGDKAWFFIDEIFFY